MPWQDVAPMLKDSSVRPYVPYNFLRDLSPECLRRLDNILERHLVIDENMSMNGNGKRYNVKGEVLCRYDGCMELFLNGHFRGQHERYVHGKAKSNG